MEEIMNQSNEGFEILAASEMILSRLVCEFFKLILI